MIKQRSISGEGENIQDSEGSAEFLDALRTNAMDDLHAAAIEYGIILKDLAVIDRQFKGPSCFISCEDVLLTVLHHRRDRDYDGQAD